jgi:hypothetical protein
MGRLARLILPLALAAGFGVGLHPDAALANCAQDAAGRCERGAAACHPPADGRCETVPGYTLSNLKFACRCMSPRQWGPQASSGSGSCRQRCSSRELTCESSARSYNQRNACVSRNTDCNSHCN